MAGDPCLLEPDAGFGVSPLLTPPLSPKVAPLDTPSSLRLRGPSPVHLETPESFVNHTLTATASLPPLTWQNFHTELDWLNMFVIFGLPLVGLVCALRTPLRAPTALFAVAYYFLTGLGITAGYHRLWAHRAYNAGVPLQYFLAIAASGSVQGSIKWWARGHRAHHRFTDTDLDPYNAHRGFFYSHVGWIVLKPRRRVMADVSDLTQSAVVRWQHKWFVPLLLIVGFGVPTLVPWLAWGDAWGGWVYAGVVRLVFVHHSTFCVNSLAHWLGETPFDDKHTPRDHFATALVTIGEGYHNFHHQFPMDYRNAVRWYQYDPTKWFIWTCEQLGLATHLKVFPENEVRKGQLTMELKKLHAAQTAIAWPAPTADLPVVSWASFKHQSSTRSLLLISGFIHDVSDYTMSHPGGAALLAKYVGEDATAAFFGGVYDHSNAAHNLLAMKRVGILHGGTPHVLDERRVPPSERLQVARFSEVFGYTGYEAGRTMEKGWDEDSGAESGRET